MKFTNNWKSRNKQWDKFHFQFRLGIIDFIKIEIDISKKLYKFTILNFTLKN